MQGLVSPRSVGQTSRLEIQVRVDVVVLSPKSAGRAVGKILRQGIVVLRTIGSSLGNFSVCSESLQMVR